MKALRILAAAAGVLCAVTLFAQEGRPEHGGRGGPGGFGGGMGPGGGFGGF